MRRSRRGNDAPILQWSIGFLREAVPLPGPTLRQASLRGQRLLEQLGENRLGLAGMLHRLGLFGI